MGGGGGSGGGAVIWRGAVAAAPAVGTSQMYPSVAVDKNGNAVIVYEHGAQIYSSRYDAT